MTEIIKMHPEYEAGCILYTAYHYDWCRDRDEYFQEIQGRLKQKAIVSTSQQLDLVSGLIHAAWAETMPALLAYVKHPCEKNIPKTLKIKSLKDLQLAISMMSTITGQSNNKSVTLNGEITVDNDCNRLGESTGTLNDEMVVQMLKSIVNKNIKLPE